MARPESKMIMGYCLHPLLTAEGAINALDMALSQGESSQGLLHHSDRGSQYGSFQYVQKLRRAGIAISMTENGDPYENAIAERVNGILKIDFHLNRSSARLKKPSEQLKSVFGTTTTCAPTCAAGT